MARTLYAAPAPIRSVLRLKQQSRTVAELQCALRRRSVESHYHPPGRWRRRQRVRIALLTIKLTRPNSRCTNNRQLWKRRAKRLYLRNGPRAYGKCRADAITLHCETEV